MPLELRREGVYRDRTVERDLPGAVGGAQAVLTQFAEDLVAAGGLGSLFRCRDRLLDPRYSALER